MQNECSEKRKNVCKKEYMFDYSIDKQMFVLYNFNRNKCSHHTFENIFINIFIKTSDDLDPYYNEENDAGIDNYIGRYVI